MRSRVFGSIFAYGVTRDDIPFPEEPGEYAFPPMAAVLVTKGTNTSSNNEIVDWFAESGHTYKIQIKPVDWTCNRATESAGWAWVKYHY